MKNWREKAWKPECNLLITQGWETNELCQQIEIRKHSTQARTREGELISNFNEPVEAET